MARRAYLLRQNTSCPAGEKACSDAKKCAGENQRISKEESASVKAGAVLKSFLGGAFGCHAFFVQESLKLAGLEHLANDVATANEFTLHIKLRDGRPV